MKKKIISLFLILFVLTLTTLASADVKKDETVYVKLNHDGSLLETKIVNHIYGYGASDYYTDYGTYSSIKSMIGSTSPGFNNKEIKWPMKLLKSKDIYYEGTINKEPPVNLSIRYYFDNTEISPKELGGKTGHLKISIGIKYNKSINWNKTNLVAQIQLSPDLDVFSNINTDGTKVVIGKKTTITFVSLPSKDQTFTIDMDGKNIYLDPISITLIPSNFNLPKDFKDGLNSLMDGIGKMDNASKNLVKGADSLANGTKKLENGMSELDNGIEKLYLGSNELNSNSRTLSDGLEEFHNGLSQMSNQGSQLISGMGQINSGMGTLSEKSVEMYNGLDKLHNGISKASEGTKKISEGYNELYKNHKELVKAANLYASSKDPIIRKMAEAIIKEGEAMEKLNSGLNEASNSFDALEKGASQLQTGFGEYKSGVIQMKESLGKTQSEIEKLPNAISQMNTSFGTLKNGINKYFDGVNDINKGLKFTHENTQKLPSSVTKLSNGQVQLKNGITSLGNGIGRINNELEENISGALFEGKENTYKSFADNEKNKNSTVQFIMRTPSIDRPAQEKVYTKTTEVKMNFLDRFLALFTKR